MKLTLELVAETIDDEERIEAALRADDLLLALKDLVKDIMKAEEPQLMEKTYRMLGNLDLNHLVFDRN